MALDLAQLQGPASFVDRPALALIGRNDGMVGEQLSKQLLEDATGLQFRSIQNASGNGIDLIGVDDANQIIWAPEVKSSTVGKYGDPGNLLQRTQNWINDAAGGSIRGQPLTLAEVEYARNVQDLMSQGYQLKPLLVQVSLPRVGSSGLPTAVIGPW